MNASHETLRKKDFNANTKQQNVVYQNLIDILDNCIPVIQKFDGKVINARFITAISEIVNPQKLHFSFGSRPGSKETTLKIGDYKNRYYPCVNSEGVKYIDRYETHITLAFTQPIDGNGQPRLNASQTFANVEETRKELSALIIAHNNDLDNYDKELEMWTQLKQAVEQYEKAFSYRLRGRIDMRRY